MKILVTGAAGFIGFHTCERLLARGDEVIGIDNLDPYYDVKLKKARLAELAKYNAFHFICADLRNQKAVEKLFADHKPHRVIHLAAQAGVRYSLINPYAYIDTNIVGFLNVLESCRQNCVEHLVYASSSSVYGANTKTPFHENQNVDHPLSLYGATKKANELMAHTYAHLYRLPVTGLRFFTVYGPWGRPDMALFLFTQKILRGEPIDVFNNGNHSRDFTFIDDIVEGVVRVIDRSALPNPSWSSDSPDPASSSAPYRLYNIGNHSPVRLTDYIACIERVTGRTAKKNFLPMQRGDVPDTYADLSHLKADIGFEPRTSIEEGVQDFVAWYRQFYGE